MDPKASTSILLLSVLLCSSLSSAFNITRLLNQHPEFSTFNDMLTQSGVAAAINSRRTITVLVVDNAAIGGITGKPPTTLRNILATHVILDYYDQTKLSDLSKKSTLLTTLFQTSGVADSMQGFLNVTRLISGEVVFGSAVKGAEHNSTLVQVVAAQPYNISVLQISQPIIAPGFNQSAPISPSSTPPPKSATAPVKGPAATPPPAKVPASAPAEEVADAPLATESEAPASSPAPSPAEDVADSEIPAKVAAPPKSSTADRLKIGASVAVGAGLVAALVAF
ncbi:hypothetical protein Nepgr_008769 [Nepenthes gracilis]|uniref:FAS1 domain-containing protein n=1 Tax=Nepenthes gracilis TaxID=150966 RepID=A0AAD3XJL2_NEPGR|nr:hypothetical protein Nepgr_008769 [Nepenthes gracilis]